MSARNNAAEREKDKHGLNPFRYRGHYYDRETGFYYLQSRYYDPETGRFLNADGLISTGKGVAGYNMYMYCGNNPVNMADPTGACGTCAYYYTQNHPKPYWTEGSAALVKWQAGYDREYNKTHKPPPATPPASGSAPVSPSTPSIYSQSIVRAAQIQLTLSQKVDIDYTKYGGAQGVDWCGYFVGWIIKSSTGIDPPSEHGWADNWKSGAGFIYCEGGDLEGIQPGDFILWDKPPANGTANHINIYVGNNMIIGGNEYISESVYGVASYDLDAYPGTIFPMGYVRIVS